MGFWALLGTVIPLGIGAAITPSLLALQVLIVSGDPWRRRSLAVIVGSASAFLLVGMLAFLGFAQLPIVTAGSTDWIGIAVRLGIGAVLALIAIWLFLPHPRLSQQVESRIQHYVAHASPWVFLGIAFALSIKDISSFAVLLPALHDIAVSDVSAAIKAGMLVLLYFLALSPVLLPAILRQFFDHRMDRAFRSIYRFTMDHQFPIVGVMCAVISGYLVITGVMLAMKGAS